MSPINSGKIQPSNLFSDFEVYYHMTGNKNFTIKPNKKRLQKGKKKKKLKKSKAKQ